MADPPCQPCPPQCESVFDRVVVSYLIKGGTRVMFELLPTFLDPGPLTAQLQYAETSNPEADWADVGLPAENQYVLVDPEQRVFGMLNTAHYRIQLTTPRGVYHSTPVGVEGVLGRRDWRLAREVVRQQRALFRYGPGGQLGYLLKRRWSGVRCPVCTDLQTGESRNPNCPTCLGTGFECGYYYPISCVWASTSPKRRHLERDGGQARGTIDDVAVQATMIQTELMSEEDVWVAAATDDRWYVHEIQNTAEIRGIALVAQVTLRQVPYSSPIYALEIPQQFRRLYGLPGSEANADQGAL